MYDLDCNLQLWNQYSYGYYQEPIEKPKNFDKMVEIATILCQGFSHVRIDLYMEVDLNPFGQKSIIGFWVIYGR